MKAYSLEVRISKQEDGLWRAEIPSLSGCFVDSETIRQALEDIQECAAMALDIDIEEGKATPDGDTLSDEVVIYARIPVVIEEHSFRRIRPRRKDSSR